MDIRVSQLKTLTVYQFTCPCQTCSDSPSGGQAPRYPCFVVSECDSPSLRDDYRQITYIEGLSIVKPSNYPPCICQIHGRYQNLQNIANVAVVEAEIIVESTHKMISVSELKTNTIYESVLQCWDCSGYSYFVVSEYPSELRQIINSDELRKITYIRRKADTDVKESVIRSDFPPCTCHLHRPFGAPKSAVVIVREVGIVDEEDLQIPQKEHESSLPQIPQDPSNFSREPLTEEDCVDRVCICIGDLSFWEDIAELDSLKVASDDEYDPLNFCL